MGRADLSGAVLDGRYRVIEPIAEGAMGVVYRAERVKLGRIVAIKVLHDVLPSELSSRKRFEIEATAMAKLEHPHCAAVLDVGVHDDKPYVVMDFVSGRNLKDVIAEGALPIPRAVEIVRQVLSGLAHAHELGIIHRDIKPANIVLSQKVGLGDHVKILDFGLARLTVGDAQNLTSGIVVGTPSYMAPEQIRGTAIDHRTDIYACGILLFELLTGGKPFVSPKDDPIEVCTMHLKTPIPRLGERTPDTDFGELEIVVAKALAKSRDDRYATAEEFANALEEIVPRKRAMTPIAGVPIVGGAAVPATGRTAVPNPAVAPAAVPAAAPEVVAPAAPAAMPNLFAGPTAAPSIATGSNLTSPGMPIGTGPTPVTRPSLPPDFDLSLAIPSPRGPVPEPSQGDRPVAPMPDLKATVGFLGVPLEPVKRSSSPIFEGSTTRLEVDDHVAPKPDDASDPKATVAFLGAAPAGPSPLAVPDAKPIEPDEAPLERPAPQFTRKQLAYGVGVVLGTVVLIAVIAVASRGGGTKQPVAAIDAAKGEAANGAKTSPATELADRASELISAGKTETALEQLLAARKQHPDDARLAYLTGKVYFIKNWWGAGLKQFREVLRLDPEFRTDAELIRIVLKAFIVSRDYPADLATFLRVDIGAPARPYLKETADSHPQAATRARAAAELRKMP